MKFFPIVVFTVFFSTNVFAADYLNLSRRDVAVDGYDLVSYHQSGPVEGNKNISFTHMDAIYYFSNVANLALFQAEPEKYLPEYGGFCAYAMLTGDQVNIDPESYKLVEGKLYLYYDGLFGDTLKKWNDKSQTETESALISKADKNWQNFLLSD